jgi:hypothetical protein
VPRNTGDSLRDLAQSTLAFFERFGVKPTVNDCVQNLREEVAELIEAAQIGTDQNHTCGGYFVRPPLVQAAKPPDGSRGANRPTLAGPRPVGLLGQGSPEFVLERGCVGSGLDVDGRGCKRLCTPSPAAAGVADSR